MTAKKSYHMSSVALCSHHRLSSIAAHGLNSLRNRDKPDKRYSKECGALYWLSVVQEDGGIE